MLLQTKSADAYGTTGTPYVFKEFRQGNIYYANQQRVAGITLNYDCHNNRLEYISWRISLPFKQQPGKLCRIFICTGNGNALRACVC